MPLLPTNCWQRRKQNFSANVISKLTFVFVAAKLAVLHMRKSFDVPLTPDWMVCGVVESIEQIRGKNSFLLRN
jgi:hypothetical protein